MKSERGTLGLSTLFVMFYSFKKQNKEFPGGPVVRTLQFYCPEGPGSIPGRGTKIPQASAWPKQNKTKQNKNMKCIYMTKGYNFTNVRVGTRMLFILCSWILCSPET